MKLEAVFKKIESFLNGKMILNEGKYELLDSAYRQLVYDAKPYALIVELESGLKPYLVLSEKYCIKEPERITQESTDIELDDDLENGLCYLFCSLVYPDENYSRRYLKEISRYKELVYESYRQSNQEKYRQAWI